ncbi:MAG: HNH/endonuclease VII fold toxin-2 domain-containing protein [Sulfitobacter geojensis]
MARGRFDARSAVGFNNDTAGGFCEHCPGGPEDCNRERRRINNECGIGNRQNNRFVQGRERYNNRRPRNNRPRRTVQVRNMTWKDEHCGAALLKLNSENITERMEQLNDLADTMFQDITDYAIDAGFDIAAERLQRWGAATAGRYAVTGLCAAGGAAVAGTPTAGVGAVPGAAVGGGVCAVGATALTVVSGVWNLFSGALDVFRSGRQINSMLDSLTTIRGNAEAVLQAAQDPEALARAQTDISNAMQVAAAANDCLRWRKCFLVPYQNTRTQGPSSMNQGGSGTPGLFDTGPMDLSDSRGCCPGQTKHHLIPEAMMANCPNYNHSAAPTVCVEGVNSSQGSHGAIHSALNGILTRRHPPGQPMTMQDGVNAAADSLSDSGVGDHCREDCIKEQLERYYDTLGCTPNTLDRNGRAPTSSPTESDF